MSLYIMSREIDKVEQKTLAWLWSAAILTAAIAASVGLIGEGPADTLYLGLVMGAVVSLSRTPCGSC